MSACQCCGHATNSHQRNGLCSGCETTLSDLRWLAADVKPHVLIRAAGGSMKDAARATGTTAKDNYYALRKALTALGCTREHLLLVAHYGLATGILPLPDGFARPAHETPVIEPPKPRTQPRPERPAPPERPVIVEHREPEPVRMLTDRAEDAPLPRAVAEANQAVEEKPMPQTHEGLNVVAQDAITSLLTGARKAAHDAGMDYQVAFAELAHLVLTGDQLPDMTLVRLAYRLGEAKGQVLALEALA
jgi:hypothetical protein